MAGPYDPPAAPIDLESSPSKIRRYRTTSVVLAVMAVLTAWIYLPPFLTTSFRAWGWQNWTFGFAPASYLLVTALIGVWVEFRGEHRGFLLLPIVQVPLLLVTGLILFVTYLDSSRLLAGAYGIRDYGHYFLLLCICPVAWYYLVVASIRWMAVFRFSSTAANRRIAAEQAQS